AGGIRPSTAFNAGAPFAARFSSDRQVFHAWSSQRLPKSSFARVSHRVAYVVYFIAGAPSAARASSDGQAFHARSSQHLRGAGACLALGRSRGGDGVAHRTLRASRRPRTQSGIPLVSLGIAR
ncbi:hypothetical protein T484DRAFT_1987034, partial [Baffinella frigidus]